MDRIGHGGSGHGAHTSSLQRDGKHDLPALVVDVFREGYDDAADDGAEWKDGRKKTFGNLVARIEELGKSGPESCVAIVLCSSDGHDHHRSSKVPLCSEKSGREQWLFQSCVVLVYGQSDKSKEASDERC